MHQQEDFRTSRASWENITVELDTLPIDAYSDCFMKLLERRKKCVGVKRHYVDGKWSSFLLFRVSVLVQHQTQNHNIRPHVFSGYWTYLENGVRMCVTYQCDFVVSDERDGLRIYNFSQHTTHKHIHRVMAVHGLTWDDMQSSVCLFSEQECGQFFLHTSCEGTSSQKFRSTLPSIQPHLSYMGAHKVVLLHFVVMVQAYAFVVQVGLLIFRRCSKSSTNLLRQHADCIFCSCSKLNLPRKLLLVSYFPMWKLYSRKSLDLWPLLLASLHISILVCLYFNWSLTLW